MQGPYFRGLGKQTQPRRRCLYCVAPLIAVTRQFQKAYKTAVRTPRGLKEKEAQKREKAKQARDKAGMFCTVSEGVTANDDTNTRITKNS